jgi:hypothetical protein
MGLIDKTGKMAIPAQYDVAYVFTEGLAGVRDGEKWSYIDTAGNAVNLPQYAEVFGFSEGLAQHGATLTKPPKW